LPSGKGSKWARAFFPTIAPFFHELTLEIPDAHLLPPAKHVNSVEQARAGEEGG
jgi:hypothetical protein